MLRAVGYQRACGRPGRVLGRRTRPQRDRALRLHGLVRGCTRVRCSRSATHACRRLASPRFESEDKSLDVAKVYIPAPRRRVKRKRRSVSPAAKDQRRVSSRKRTLSRRLSIVRAAHALAHAHARTTPVAPVAMVLTLAVVWPVSGWFERRGHVSDGEQCRLARPPPNSRPLAGGGHRSDWRGLAQRRRACDAKEQRCPRLA